MASEIRFADGLIYIKFYGDFSGADLNAVMAELAVLEARHRPTPNRLIDATEIGASSLSFSDLRGVTDTRKRFILANPIRTAVLYRSAASLGLARMFQSLNDHPQITVQLFDDRESAEKWLMERGT